MVRRKTTRQLTRSKPKKPDISVIDDDDEERKENLLKRLDDFDMQVKDIVQKMESDKQALINSVKHLYFVDEQRTQSAINNMPWMQYLQQNTPHPELVIRKSIAYLINKAEDPALITKTTKRKRNGTSSDETPIPVTGTTRATRSRATKNVLTESNVPTIEITAIGALGLKKGGKSNKIVQSTPINQNTQLPYSSLIITPKFDPRTPLPMHTLRKPKIGEIAISLKGSPLQVAPKNYSIGGMLESDLSDQTREQLQDLQKKVSELLKL